MAASSACVAASSLVTAFRRSTEYALLTFARASYKFTTHLTALCFTSTSHCLSGHTSTYGTPRFFHYFGTKSVWIGSYRYADHAKSCRCIQWTATVTGSDAMMCEFIHQNSTRVQHRHLTPPVVVKLGACRHCAGSVETVETSDIVVQSNQRTSSHGKTGCLQALCWFC